MGGQIKDLVNKANKYARRLVVPLAVSSLASCAGVVGVGNVRNAVPMHNHYRNCLSPERFNRDYTRLFLKASMPVNWEYVDTLNPCPGKAYVLEISIDFSDHCNPGLLLRFFCSEEYVRRVLEREEADYPIADYPAENGFAPEDDEEEEPKPKPDLVVRENELKGKGKVFLEDRFD